MTGWAWQRQRTIRKKKEISHGKMEKSGKVTRTAFYSEIRPLVGDESPDERDRRRRTLRRLALERDGGGNHSGGISQRRRPLQETVPADHARGPGNQCRLGPERPRPVE